MLSHSLHVIGDLEMSMKSRLIGLLPVWFISKSILFVDRFKHGSWRTTGRRVCLPVAGDGEGEGFERVEGR